MSKKDKKKNIMCFKCKKTATIRHDDGEEIGKNGSNFLVLNTQDSSDDESELTKNHDHLVAVQENDSCDDVGQWKESKYKKASRKEKFEI